MRNERNANDMFNFVEIIIDLDDKLYKRIIKKRFDQSYKRVEIFFELTIEYSQEESRFN